MLTPASLLGSQQAVLSQRLPESLLQEVRERASRQIFGFKHGLGANLNGLADLHLQACNHPGFTKTVNAQHFERRGVKLCGWAKQGLFYSLSLKLDLVAVPSNAGADSFSGVLV